MVASDSYVTAVISVPVPTPKPIVIKKYTQSVAENIVLGESLARAAGYSNADWACLYELGMNESGWDHTIWNRSGSGAFGIAQSLPASKYDSYGDRNSPLVQIRWFLDYVKNRYKTPCAADKFQIANNWY